MMNYGIEKKDGLGDKLWICIKKMMDLYWWYISWWIMELKKKMTCEMNYGFAMKKNDAYWVIIYNLMNYGIKKNGLRRIMDLQKKMMVIE